MSVCWYCHWGWPQPVADIFREAASRCEGGEASLELGPSHIVWADENFEDESICSCIDECGNPKEDATNEHDMTIVRESLFRLLDIPLAIRVPRPDYDGSDVTQFPPPKGMEMCKISLSNPPAGWYQGTEETFAKCREETKDFPAANIGELGDKHAMLRCAWNLRRNLVEFDDEWDEAKAKDQPEGLESLLMEVRFQWGCLLDHYTDSEKEPA